MTTLDRTAGTNGSGSAFSSGSTALTSTGNEVVFAAVSVPQASGSPSWTSGWRDLGNYVVGAHTLGRSYQLPTTVGTFAASESAPGNWLATVVTFKP